MNSDEKKLVSELVKIITLANSRGAFKLEEASYIHKVLVTLEKEMNRVLPSIPEDLVIMDVDDK